MLFIPKMSKELNQKWFGFFYEIGGIGVNASESTFTKNTPI